jgi:hypothetical protein
VVVAAVALAACEPAPDCSSSLLYGDTGFRLASPVGTTFFPTATFSDPSGQAPESCHYARNQGDEVCTEDGLWIDMNPGERAGTVEVTPLNHACGGFVVGSSYDLVYSFDQVPGFLWIEYWSNNQ